MTGIESLDKDKMPKAWLKAGFEVGIKLGAALHQFVGIPISESNVKIVEEAIRSAILLQPFVKEVKVKINKEMLERGISSFSYTTLSPEMLEIEVLVEVEGVSARGFLKWREDLNYPLMEVQSDQ